MGFGKRVCEFLLVIAAFILIGSLVWYLLSDMRGKGYEKEGTLVLNSQEYDMDEAAFPAFVTNPSAKMYGQQEIQRSGKGI